MLESVEEGLLELELGLELDDPDDMPPPDAAPGVLDGELLLGLVAEPPPAEPLGLEEGLDDELELEGGVALELPPALPALLSLPQPASAKATAAANSSDVFINSPLKGKVM